MALSTETMTSMDSSSQLPPYQPPIAVWELLRDPILAFYQEGMDRRKLEKILGVIENSLLPKKFWYIPFTKGIGQADQETQRLLEEQHTAFCMWLLGRLFCILGRESLADTHASCIKAQIGILAICAENEYMLRCFFAEYISCLSDLISLHSSEIFLSNESHLLRRFTPLPVKALENLNLIPKYILIKSLDLVLHLEKYLVEIIDSMLPSIVFLHQDLLDKCWSLLIQLMQVSNTELKISILKTFSKIVSTAGCNNNFALSKLCHTLKFVAQNIPNYARTKICCISMQDLLSAIGELANVIVYSECGTVNFRHHRDLLTILHSVLNHWNVDENSARGLEIVCKNVSVLMRYLPSGSVDPENFCFLMKLFETQQVAVKILSQCVFDQMLEFIKSLDAYKSAHQSEKSPVKAYGRNSSSQIDATLAFPVWTLLHNELFEEISGIQSNFPDQPSKQFFLEIKNVAGKVQALLQCAVEATLLYSKSPEALKLRVSLSFFPDKIATLVSFFNFLIKKLVFLRKNDAVIWFPEDIIKSSVMSVGYLFLLSESESMQEEDKELAMSIAAIPWLDHQVDSKLSVKPEFVQLVSNFPEVKSEEIRISSIKSMSYIPSCNAWCWKLSTFSMILNLFQDFSSHNLVAEAVKAVPSLLLENYSEMHDILFSALPSILESESEILLAAVAITFPTIVCVMSGSIVPLGSLGENGLLERSFICLTCQKSFPGTPCDTVNVLSVFKDALCKFMCLLSSPVVAVRRIMAASLGSLVLHLPAMYQPETVNVVMKYAEDEDRHVRLTFSRMLKFLIFSRDWMEGKGVESEHLQEEHIPLTQVDRVELSHSRPRLEKVLQMLWTALRSRLGKNNSAGADIQETLLATIVDIGCVPLDCVLLPVLKICLICVSHPMFSHPSLGQVYIKRIAVAHNTNVTNLYHRFQTDLCQVLVSGMGMNFHARPTQTTVMDKVVYSFGFESVTAWLTVSIRSILPTLVVLAVKYDDVAFLKKILALLPTSPATLIKENFQFIYPYAFINESDQVVGECVKLLEELSSTSAQQLKISSFKTIHNELLLHYYAKKQRVEEGICQLINVLEKKSNKPQTLDNPPRREDIAKHLEQRFLGVLVHFDSLLESSSAEEKNKIKALQSIPEIIRLMGPKYITPVRFKVLSTLRTALRLTHCDFPHLSCSAWEAFIQSVDIHELGPLLGSVTASVLPLVDQFPDEIASLLDWLVVRHEHELSDYIPDLFFLPDLPALHNIFKIVQNHLKRKMLVLNESQKLSDYLQQPLRFISHDNVDMRKHGLEYLLLLLKEKQMQFTLSLLQEEIVDNSVAKLLTLLIEGCRDTDEDIQQLCVESLGVLGALDPGHLPLKKPGIGTPQIYSVDEDRYAVQALITLAKAYQAARNTRYLDSFAVAIQELLRCYNISSHPTSNKKSLWDYFPSKIQQVMAPLENSSYYMTSLQYNVWPHPLFGTRYASSLTNWAHTWACRIVKFIEDSKSKDMFTVCIPSLRLDINCVLFFLPFIVLYAVVYGQEDQHKMITEEMTYIIQQHLRTNKEDIEDNTSHAKYQVWLDRSVPVLKNGDSDSATHVLCAKTVFTLLDFMEKWVGLAKKRTDASRKESDLNSSSMNVHSVQKFLKQFSKLDLSHGNYGVNEYARSLMYLEDHLMDHKELIKNEEHLSFLQRIYAQLNELDGIKGVLAIQCTQPKLLDTIVFHEVAGQHQEALACLELLSEEHTNDAVGIRIQQGIIRSLLSLDQPYAALKIAEGALAQTPECHGAFLEAQAECFWRMNSFEKLGEVLKDPKLDDSTAWGVGIGRCLMDIRSNDHVSLQKHLRPTRSYLSKALSTASLENGSYLQGYPHVIKLHMLQEVQEASKVIAMIQSADTLEGNCVEAIKNLVKLWADRLELVQATSSVQEPLLRLRRCLLQLASTFVAEDKSPILSLLDQQLGSSWLKSAEVARIAECYHQAYIYLLNAEKYKPKRHFIELAKLHWVKHEEDHALSTLRRGLDEHFPNSKEFKDMDADVLVEERKTCAEAKLLIACYNDQSMNVNTDVNISNYNEAAEVYQRWEKSWAHLAEYYDRLSSNEESRLGKYQVYAVKMYAKSLRFGCGLIFHSMSRLLTIWLDYGSKYHKAFLSKDQFSARELTERRRNLHEMNTHITSCLEILPPYMFMTGFSQLVSRICHPIADVYNVIKSIMVKLLTYYQQQTLWMLLAVNRSTHAMRKVRSRGVLDDPQVKRVPDLVRLIGNFLKVGDLLSELCQKPVPKELNKTSVSAISRNLPKIFRDPCFSKIMMPLQNCRTLLLPQKEINSSTSHEPFPLNMPTIAGIQEEVTILSSLQRPRKITFRGSDGLLYDMMCKDKDDLRLDARVMEFNSIVNKYLQKAPASRSRCLNIRTYSVVPLNEDCGLIEWVPNLSAFRIIVTQFYKEMGCFMNSKELKKYMLDKDASLKEKRENFKSLRHKHPPVFQNWFRNNFSDSRSWFEARKSYVRTTAVMSMVGYILGLGDRHGENILLDNTCGDVVHVDFNCLFNKGERFDCPERVPFRLTHNMVSAMGPTNVEGTFRIACEITLKLLRDEKETLLSVLRPFVYDPKQDEQVALRRIMAMKKNPDPQEEITNDLAIENVKNIDQRLSGVVKSGQQLSVEGQAHVLIQEAASIDNLCQMYIGWGAYL